jgi:regulator of RNase E activity RraA
MLNASPRISRFLFAVRESRRELTKYLLLNRINLHSTSGVILEEVLQSRHSRFRRTPMIPQSRFRHFRRTTQVMILAFIAVAGVAAFAWPPSASPHQGETQNTDEASLLDGFRHVEAASVSDALEQITGKKMYMSHHMRPIFPSKFAGFAVTVLLKKEPNHDPNALSGMLAAIDSGGPNSIYVMVVEDGADIAGMGGLMGTAMSARNFSGAVIDGGVRDVAYLHKIGFPVYSLGVVPSTSVSHYRFAGANVPVVCDGVSVSAADIIVADADGVVVVPRSSAAQTLKLAQEMDFKEHSMYAYIEKLKSIEEAVKKFGRL